MRKIQHDETEMERAVEALADDALAALDQVAQSQRNGFGMPTLDEQGHLDAQNQAEQTDRIEPTEQAELAEQTDRIEPTEQTDQAEQIELAEQTDQVEPTEQVEPHDELMLEPEAVTAEPERLDDAEPMGPTVAVSTLESDASNEADAEVPPDEESMAVKSILEALLFVSGEPLSVERCVSAVGHATKAQVREALLLLERDYAQRDGAVQLVQLAGGYRLVTKPEFASWIRRLERSKAQAKLSRSAVEALAIIAYRQPVVRGELEKIRGVETSGVIRTLCERKLVRIVGRKDEPGRPIMYGTTKQFLEHFGLRDLSELPPLREFKELGDGDQTSLLGETAEEDSDAEAGAEVEVVEAELADSVDTAARESEAQNGQVVDTGEDEHRPADLPEGVVFESPQEDMDDTLALEVPQASADEIHNTDDEAARVPVSEQQEEEEEEEEEADHDLNLNGQLSTHEPAHHGG